MACFKALCCIWQPPSPSDDAVVPQVPVPVRAAQPPASTDIHVPALTEVPVEAPDSPSVNIGGVRAATAVENTPPCSPAGPSPSNVDTPASAPTQGFPSNRTGALAPALTEVQPTVPRSPEESVDTPVPVHTEEVPTASARSRFRLDPAKEQSCRGSVILRMNQKFLMEKERRCVCFVVFV
ncbi:hypothetical protein BKA82DRAFT_393742 [Pisolithus tinctorius]|uniref:Uncharacterized protein n=1 Tax=Pisolithus tinctorius Marx 270 TaxID=870435 RepID=A0A0C3PH35_PISTI|nr:hypothetical protein BKA82DRAFT_393742 [Pisolithus tinctorius]KIO07731.1 hypothetical protein M404DRAFT_393742 [Pisolithus tinctorius Marx 270]